MLCFGGNWLVNGSIILSSKIKLSKLIVGMTVVAYGTSVPELASSIAAIDIHNELILGNIIGSNTSNIGMVIGIIALISPIVINKPKIKKQLLIMFLTSVLLLILLLDKNISNFDGIILLASMVMFSFFTYINIKKEYYQISDKNIINVTGSYYKSIIFILFGVLLLYAGSLLTVDSIVISSKLLGISEKTIGISVLAIGTSLPELITSILAIRKGHHDIGIGNVIGSNIYNILLIFGVVSVVSEIYTTSNIYYDYIVMFSFSCAILYITIKTSIITRKIGFLFMFIYILYLVSSIISFNPLEYT